MPSRKKSSMFACSFCACVGSLALVCVALATPRWASSELRFARAASNLTISLSYGLFRGTCEQFVDVGLQVPEKTFQVSDALSSSSSSSSSRSLNVAIVALLVLALLSSLLSAAFTCTNAVSNPYQTFLGPLGVYTWNSLCGVLILLAMILFPVNVEGNRLAVELVPEGCSTHVETHLGSKHSYGYSYWIMLLILFLNIASLTIIYFYDHATYSKKKEQERPIENAPKDVILF
ncbi:PREDICTED: clarin-3 [Ficedula albicollis]|uniref:clarin-3 n=1 Tax=Ficedula albicollis TaxID=59894 RepID=UPI0007AD818A|nr:PREDICTED: clarin-3 [Ficedula albicollis]